MHSILFPANIRAIIQREIPNYDDLPLEAVKGIDYSALPGIGAAKQAVIQQALDTLVQDPQPLPVPGMPSNKIVGILDATIQRLTPLATAEQKATVREWTPPASVLETFAVSEDIVNLDQKSIGMPGTRILAGLPATESNPNARPWAARGRLGMPGAYQEARWTEPVISKAYSDVSAQISTGIWSLSVPRSYQSQELQDFAGKIEDKIKNIESGFDRFIQDAATHIITGFVPFEVRWDLDSGPAEIVDIEYRDPASLYEWVYDDRQRLVGANFRHMGEQSSEVFIPYGDTPRSKRLAIVNTNAHGADYEGKPPIRPVLAYIEIKKLLLQLLPLSYQMYGVPVAIVSEVVEAVMDLKQNASPAEINALIGQLRNIRAKVAPILQVPAVIKLEFVTPAGEFPDIVPVLRYLDDMIALTMSAEGALLGLATHGSHALSNNAMSRAQSTAYAYARNIIQLLNQLTKLMFQWKFGNLSEYPKWNFGFDLGASVSDFIGQVRSLYGPNLEVSEFAPAIKRTLEEKMGLDPFALDTETE